MTCLQANAQAIGQVRLLQEILELDSEQIEEVLLDEDEFEDLRKGPDQRAE